jgi:hypothetical protein
MHRAIAMTLTIGITALALGAGAAPQTHRPTALRRSVTRPRRVKRRGRTRIDVSI